MNQTKTLSDLILVCIYEIEVSGEKCSFGRLVVKCFLKYPEIFSLNEFKNYPDSLKLDRPLRDLRLGGLISGSPVTYYHLTAYGKKVAEKLATSSSLELNKKFTKVTRSPALETINRIENSQHYREFTERKSFSISEMKIRALLNLTMETPQERVLSELFYLRHETENLGRSDIIKFFNKYIDFFERSKK